MQPCKPWTGRLNFEAWRSFRFGEVESELGLLRVVPHCGYQLEHCQLQPSPGNQNPTQARSLTSGSLRPVIHTLNYADIIMPPDPEHRIATPCPFLQPIPPASRKPPKYLLCTRASRPSSKPVSTPSHSGLAPSQSVMSNMYATSNHGTLPAIRRPRNGPRRYCSITYLPGVLLSASLPRKGNFDCSVPGRSTCMQPALCPRDARHG